eukprot:scaffold62821_cov53-Phaeocystis_antarctica.AAC.1
MACSAAAAAVTDAAGAAAAWLAACVAVRRCGRLIPFYPPYGLPTPRGGCGRRCRVDRASPCRAGVSSGGGGGCYERAGARARARRVGGESADVDKQAR